MSALMMTLMLTGPIAPVTQYSASNVSHGDPPSAVTTKQELRTTYAQLLRDSSRRAHSKPAQIVPRLVRLYRELEHNPVVSRSEASRMRRGLKTRLMRIEGRILRERRRQSQHDHRSTDKKRRVSLAGGGAQNGMSQLIELIQNNIAPDSWDTAGIEYFAGNTSGGAGGSGEIDLVELIQQTIAPDTWDVNGGFGSITIFGK